MFQRRLRAALDLLSATGMWRSVYAPPLFRLLWRCNVQIAPPHFRSFGSNALAAGSFFGIAWTTAMWLLIWRGTLPAAIALGRGALAGLLFGLGMAAYYRWSQRKHDLPEWGALSDA